MTVQISERPAYVQFEVRSDEDRDATLKAGHFVGRDVNYVIVTPPGGSLTVEAVAEEWLRSKQHDQFYVHYTNVYEAWKKGLELPVDGTPIRTWPAATPSEIKICIDANIRTVEDLAAASENTLRRLGMGARAIKTKAEAWLDAAKGTGVAAGKIETLERDNKDLVAQVADLTKSVKELLAEKSDAAPPPTRRPGRPRKNLVEAGAAA